MDHILNALNGLLFANLFGVPFIVLWLGIAGVYLTLKMNFINVTMFKHSIECLSGKFDKKSKKDGDVSSFQALASSAAATIGLGNIAGVAVAVSMGGPGAIFWMMVFGVFAMTTKFVEVSLGHKYRIKNSDGTFSGGGFYYLRDGIAGLGYAKTGKVLSYCFAVLCFFGTLSLCMFQSNQMVTLIVGSEFSGGNSMPAIVSAILTVIIFIIIVGGVTRIASVADKMVPAMALIYILSCVVILIKNASNIPDSLSLILREAFNFESGFAGFMGVVVCGARRALFANEGGMGTSPIVNAAASTQEHIRQGIVILIEPFIVTLICLMSGLVVVVTGAYTSNMEGVLMTKVAFASVSSWFPIFVIISGALFAFSTVMTNTYYCEKAWGYITKNSYLKFYKYMVIALVFMGGVMSLNVIVSLSDVFILLMTIPNIIGVYALSSEIKKDLQTYKDKLAAGKFN